MSEFSELKAKYTALAGKNPPPMSTDALRAKVAELEAAAAAAAPPEQDPPEQDPPEQDPPEQDPPANDEAPKPAATSRRPQALLGSDILPSVIELVAGVSVQLGDVVRRAFKASGLTVEEFNEQHPSHREEQLQAAIAEMRQEAEREAAESTAPSLEDELAELGLSADENGGVEVTMLTGLSGPDICLVNGDTHRCTAAEAVRLVRSGAAERP